MSVHCANSSHFALVKLQYGNSPSKCFSSGQRDLWLNVFLGLSVLEQRQTSWSWPFSPFLAEQKVSPVQMNQTPGSAAVFAFFTVQVREEKRAASTCDHSAICDQPWATAWLIYDVTGSCGKQQHGVVKKPPYPRLSPPQCRSRLPFISCCLIFRFPSLISVSIPQAFCISLAISFFSRLIPASENEKSHGLFHDCIYKIRSYGGLKKWISLFLPLWGILVCHQKAGTP